jgi:hypothetical protein
MQTFIPDFSTIIRAEIHRVNKSTLIHFCFKLACIADERIIGTYPNTALLNRAAPMRAVRADTRAASLFCIAAHF